MRFLRRSDVRPWFEGKSVVIVGSGPGCAENRPGFVDSHDVVVRVNNYKLRDGTGSRTDVFYSFFGTSIRKSREDLIRDGVTLCMSKLPNADLSQRSDDNPNPIDATWHRANGKMIGLDYRPHYARRERMGFWFCDTYVPAIADLMAPFEVLGRRQPTTGFAAIYDVMTLGPVSVHLTGFDGFRSGLHNVDEPHELKNEDDPYRHAPERELAWVKSRLVGGEPLLSVDTRLMRELLTVQAA